MKTTPLLTLAGVGLALAAAGCVDRQAIAQGKRTRDIIADPRVPVTVTEVYPSSVQNTIEVTGSIAADDDVTVGAMSAGRVVSVRVKDGDQVTAGQVLATVDDVDAQNRLRQALSQVEAARAQLTQARTEAQAAPLRSSSSVRSAQARLRQAEQTVAKLKAGSREAEKQQAEIQVVRAKSDLDTAKSSVDRTRRLFNEGAISKADLETVENRYDNAMAAYRAALENRSLVLDPVRQEDMRIAEQELAAAREAVRIEQTNKSLDRNYGERVRAAEANLQLAQEQVGLARKAVSDTVVKASVSGRISGRPVQAGSVVAPGSPVARIVGLNGLYFEPEVTEAQVAKIHQGTKVRLTVEALGSASAEGVVAALNPQASNVGRLYTLRVRIDSPPAGMKPGMFAKGTVSVGAASGVYMVPDKAVLRDGDRAWVFVAEMGTVKTAAAEEDGHSAPSNEPPKQALVSVRRMLTVRRIEGATVEAVGLRPGDKVVTTGQVNLLEGAELRIEDGKAKSPAEPSAGGKAE